VTRLTGWKIEIWFSAGAGNFSHCQLAQTDFGPTQPLIQWIAGSYNLGDKAAGAWSWLPTSI